MITQVKAALAALCLCVVAPTVQAETLTVDVSGAVGDSLPDRPGLNTVRTFNIGADARITAVEFTVNITAFFPSYFGEASLVVSDSARTNSFYIWPGGLGSQESGTETFSGGADLVDLGIDIYTGLDGILRLEWFDSLPDDEVTPDSIWNSGTITFTYTPGTVTGAVPEPATWAMMIAGIGAVGASARRRRVAAVAA